MNLQKLHDKRFLCVSTTLSLCIHKIVMEPEFFLPLNRIRYLYILDINAPQTVWKENSKFMSYSEEDVRDW